MSPMFSLRAENRRNVQFQAAFYVVDEKTGERRMVRTLSKDLSRHGMFALTTESVKVGADLDMALVYTPKVGAPLKAVVKGKVIHLSDRPPQGVGIRFENPSSDVFKIIETIDAGESTISFDVNQPTSWVNAVVESLSHAFLDLWGLSLASLEMEDLPEERPPYGDLIGLSVLTGKQKLAMQICLSVKSIMALSLRDAEAKPLTADRLQPWLLNVLNACSGTLAGLLSEFGVKLAVEKENIFVAKVRPVNRADYTQGTLLKLMLAGEMIQVRIYLTLDHANSAERSSQLLTPPIKEAVAVNLEEVIKICGRPARLEKLSDHLPKPNLKAIF